MCVCVLVCAVFHAGERPYLCDLCGASFTQGGKLHSHRRKHTGEKPYRCAECGENFKEKDQLNIHRRKHTGIQPYTCKMCGKAMQKASHLANHIRVHTGMLKNVVVFYIEKIEMGRIEGGGRSLL